MSSAAVKDEVDGEEETLSSLINKKKPTNGGTEPRPKVKKLEDNEDDDKPISKISAKKIPTKVEPKHEDDDDDVPIGKRSSNSNTAEKTKVKKKVLKYEDSEEDEKPIAKRSSNKDDKDLKKNKTRVEKKVEKSKVVVVEEKSKKREKKVYDLPGQKRDPPEERDPLRIFYESLYEQLPGSEMAAFWMMESGLLPMDVAKKVYEKKQKKNQQQKLGSPIKAVTSVKRTTTHSVTVKKTTTSTSSAKKLPEPKSASKQSKKRKAEDSESDNDDDDDFVPLARKKLKK